MRRRPARTRRAAHRAALLAFILIAPWQLAGAQDTIYFSTSEKPGSYGTISGEIVGYNYHGLRLRVGSGRVTRIDADHVRRIETRRTAEQLAGDRSLEQGAFREALSQFRTALDNENRTWLRREILAQAVRCYRELSDWQSAAETFLLVYRNDPTTDELASIPLVWIAQEPSRQIATSAKDWIQRKDSPAAVLIGASHLLTSPDRAAAISHLRPLTANADRRIAWLAQTQLWRVEAVDAEEQELRRWNQAIEQMPSALRPGPYVVIGSAWSMRGAAEESALAFLRVGILYADEHSLAAHATYQAARALDAMGDAEGAVWLYRETFERYKGTPEASDAQQQLKRRAPTPRGIEIPGDGADPGTG